MPPQLQPHAGEVRAGEVRGAANDHSPVLAPNFTIGSKALMVSQTAFKKAMCPQLQAHTNEVRGAIRDLAKAAIAVDKGARQMLEETRRL